MSEELDWTGLETAVHEASSRLKDLRDENRSLRREVSKLTKALAAGEEAPAADDTLIDTVRERLEALAANLAALQP